MPGAVARRVPARRVAAARIAAAARAVAAGIVGSMAASVSRPRIGRPRRRPFGVLVICGLLALEAAIFGLAVVALFGEHPDEAGSDAVIALRAFGFDLSIVTDASSAVRIAEVALGILFALTAAQVVLLLLLLRVGWVLTMLSVGASLFFNLLSVWRGIEIDSLSLLILSITALYLNQSEVRHAFGIGRSRIDAAVERSAEAMGDGAMGAPT